MKILSVLLLAVVFAQLCNAFKSLGFSKPFQSISRAPQKGLRNHYSMQQLKANSIYDKNIGWPKTYQRSEIFCQRERPTTELSISSSSTHSGNPASGGTTPMAACVVNLIKNIVRFLPSPLLQFI